MAYQGFLSGINAHRSTIFSVFPDAETDFFHPFDQLIPAETKLGGFILIHGFRKIRMGGSLKLRLEFDRRIRVIRIRYEFLVGKREISDFLDISGRNVSSAENESDFSILLINLSSKDRSQRNRAGRFDQFAFAIENGQCRRGNGFLRYRDYFIEQIGEDGKGYGIRLQVDGQSVGESRTVDYPSLRSARHAGGYGSVIFRLDSNEAHVGMESLHPYCDAARETSASERNDEGVDIRNRF